MYIRRTAFWILVLAIAIPGWNRVSASAKFGPRANTGAAKAFAGQTEEEATGPEGSVPIEPPVRKRKPLALQQLIGASWRTDHTFQSSIQITNQLSIADLDVTPVLYMADGAEYPLPSVHVPRLAVETVSINDAVAAAPLEILPHLSSYGSAVLRYTWHWDAAVSGSILNLDVPRSLTFTSRFVGPGKMTSHPQRQVIEGLWWVPFPRSGGFVSLMNTTSRPLDAVVEAFGPRGERVRVVNQHIGPNSTSIAVARTDR